MKRHILQERLVTEMNTFFDSVLRGIGKRLEILTVPLILFPFIQAFLFKMLDGDIPRLGYAMWSMLLYSILISATAFLGFYLGWFDRRPWRLVSVLSASTLGFLFSACAVMSTYTSFDRDNFLLFDLKLALLIVLIGVAIASGWLDRGERRSAKRKLIQHLSET